MVVISELDFICEWEFTGGQEWVVHEGLRRIGVSTTLMMKIRHEHEEAEGGVFLAKFPSKWKLMTFTFFPRANFILK